jgi:hypothetical protein
MINEHEAFRRSMQAFLSRERNLGKISPYQQFTMHPAYTQQLFKALFPLIKSGKSRSMNSSVMQLLSRYPSLHSILLAFIRMRGRKPPIKRRFKFNNS